MAQIIRVNLATQSIVYTDLNEDALLGGRHLTSTFINREVPPTANALGRHNKLIFACGPLAATPLSCCNRLSIGAKSPLTGTIKESNAGGITGYAMGRLGIRAIIFEDKPNAAGWSLLHVDKDGAKLLAADDLAGLSCSDKVARLKARFGEKISIALIGVLGERLQLTAGIANIDSEGEPSRYSGRGGLGAVMASKGLQAVVFDATGTDKIAYADSKRFYELNRTVAQRVKEAPATGKLFPQFGTACVLDVTSNFGALPTRNFRTGKFDQASKINGQSLHDTILARGGEGSTTHACMPGCLVRCSNIYPDAQGRKLCSPVEYENIGLLGSNLCIDSLDTIALLNKACNELGGDTIEIGAALGVAMDMGLCDFGDEQGALRLMDEIRQGTPLGRVLASGAGITGSVFGCLRVPTVKNQAMPAYDPRSMKGLGVTFATSAMGADHTAGNTMRAPVTQHLKEGQVAASKETQHKIVCYDNLGMCILIAAALDFAMLAELIAARHGCTVSVEEIVQQGRETLAAERDFNIRAGFTQAHDKIPEFMEEEINPASGVAFDLSPEEMQGVFEA